ncbi:hypothetical protein Tco_1427741 [Tanacetum coccineum]
MVSLYARDAVSMRCSVLHSHISMKKTNTLPQFVHGMQCNTPADDYELHYVSENPFDQREFTPPLKKDIVGAGTSRNVRRRLVPGHSGIFGNAAMFSRTAELRLRTANTTRGCDTTDINCVPIRRVFDRFRNMRTPYIEADSMTHPGMRPPVSIFTYDPFKNLDGKNFKCHGSFDIEGFGAGRNSRSCLSAGDSSMLRNANVFSEAIELRPRTADTIRSRGTQT